MLATGTLLSHCEGLCVVKLGWWDLLWYVHVVITRGKTLGFPEPIGGQLLFYWYVTRGCGLVSQSRDVLVQTGKGMVSVCCGCVPC